MNILLTGSAGYIGSHTYITLIEAGYRPIILDNFSNSHSPDVTGIRDYIHVVDLAEAHLAALKELLECGETFTVNLGTGRGFSVLEVARAFEQVSGRPVPFQIAQRRPGDVAECWADPSSAQRIIGWRAQKSLIEMCADSWRWQQQNPNGYISFQRKNGEIAGGGSD